MTTTQKQKHCALYSRVSTLEQSTEAQIRALKLFCEQNKITDFELYTDEGASGAKVSRPALDRLMNNVREGKVDKVIVFAFSRFARSVSHLLAALDEFRKNGVQFISTTERIDTESPMGRSMFAILGSLAQLERELIVDALSAASQMRKQRVNT